VCRVRTETKTHRSTSNPMMRGVVIFTTVAMLLGLPGTSSAFTWPLMLAASAQNNERSHCPGEKQHDDSCPHSACFLICPYTVEKTAVLNGEGVVLAFILEGQPSSALIRYPLSDASLLAMGPQYAPDSAALYLRNRVLLI
jgi:hypothetical protein